MGMRMDAVKYAEPVRRYALEQIRNRRDSFVLPAEAEKDVRFKDDAGVLWRIESHYTEEEFMACPGVAVDAGLLDAAQSDWWYNHEKDYGDEPDYDEGDDE